MKNGLYKATFRTPLGEGYGVVTLRDGHVGGGDSMMFYVGSYELNDGKFTATVNIDVHSNLPGFASVLGAAKATLNLSGTYTGDSADVHGTSPQAPGVEFNATLNRLSD